jgi:hypothetical protein
MNAEPTFQLRLPKGVGHRVDGAHLLVGHDHGISRGRGGLPRVVGFECHRSVFEFAAKDSDLAGRIDRERHAVAGDTANLNGNVVSDVDLLADFPA